MCRIRAPATHLVIAMAWLALTGCGPAAAASPTPTAQPPTDALTPIPHTAAPTALSLTDTPEPAPTLVPQAAVVQAWQAAWNSKDLEAFMALLAENAVLDRGPYGLLTGKEAIRAVVIEEMEEGLKGRLSNLRVVGDHVYCHYEVLLNDKVIDEGESVTIVRDGKIVSDLPAP